MLVNSLLCLCCYLFFATPQSTLARSTRHSHERRLHARRADYIAGVSQSISTTAAAGSDSYASASLTSSHGHTTSSAIPGVSEIAFSTSIASAATTPLTSSSFAATSTFSSSPSSSLSGSFSSPTRAPLSSSTILEPSSVSPTQPISTLASTSTSATIVPGPGPSPTEPSQELQILLDRRIEFTISSLSSYNDIPTWINTISSDGTWPDVNYTSGCNAQRANWPAQEHLNRINTFAAAYHGSSSFNSTTSAYTNDEDLRAIITTALDWWFDNDFTNVKCLDNGGKEPCPCGTPGLWNTNWFSNIILAPRLIGQICLVLLQEPIPLTPSQYSNCVRYTSRAFATFNYDLVGVTLAGANTLDVASIGVAQGLLQGDENVVSQAYDKVHQEVVVQDADRADGIRPDGSFAQHLGILYNGNYGKDYTNAVLALEIQGADTKWEAENASRSAVESYVDGFQWSIYRNILTDVLHWDFSVISRFIAFPTIDIQPTTDIQINLTRLDVLGQQWDSSVLSDVATRLQIDTQDANAGQLYGNRMFYNNDYMVQRGDGYVSTVRMYSSRTYNTECVNTANPLGFHLSDGTLYTYISGSEYEDIAAAWDWNLIPGTTLDYGGTPLQCSTIKQKGTESFVGGASAGKIGVSAMRYTNPITRNVRWQKAWFFFDEDIQHVVVSSVSSNSSAPIVHVLDQKKHHGPIIVGGSDVSSGVNTTILRARTLWHDNVGYVFHSEPNSSDSPLVVRSGNRSGAWSALGTSPSPPITVDLFAAYIQQNSSQSDKRLSYSIYPARSQQVFDSQTSSLTNEDSNSTSSGSQSFIQTLQNDENITVAYDSKHSTAGVVFWSALGGEARLSSSSSPTPFSDSQPSEELRIQADRAIVMLVHSTKDGLEVTVADPTQVLTNVSLTFEKIVDGRDGYGQEEGTIANKNLNVSFPSGSMRGSSVTSSVWW